MTTIKAISKLISTTAVAFAILGSTGCSTVLVNLTPRNIPENPSGIYTFSVEANLKSKVYIEDTFEATIVVNGETHPMTQSGIGDKIWNYDFKMPSNKTEVGYYYIIEYDYRYGEDIQHRELKSDLYNAQLINRYIIQLETHRAPVGSRVAIVGRGFSSYDVLLFGGLEVPTTYASANALSFVVPSLPSGKNYEAVLRSGEGDLTIGQFRIDEGEITALLENANLGVGEQTLMLFTINFEAPPGGLYVDVTTDVPASIIMPEVVIPEGASSVSIRVQGGDPGNGTVFVEAPGFNLVKVPISVF